MDQKTQIALLDELLGLQAAKSAYLDEAVTGADPQIYQDDDLFARERQRLFLRHPQIVAHVSEMPNPGDFLTREGSSVPLLLTRDRDGQLNGFYNICRHRGARLVGQEAGCKHRFSCPYHAWTWDNTGRFINAPHRAQGFPDLNPEEKGLKNIQTWEALGFIWAQIEGEPAPNLSGLEPELSVLGLSDFEIHAQETQTWDCNWKIIVEGGLEAYHFRVAHAQTIGALFHDNLSTYQCFGPHIRSRVC